MTSCPECFADVETADGILECCRCGRSGCRACIFTNLPEPNDISAIGREPECDTCTEDEITEEEEWWK